MNRDFLVPPSIRSIETRENICCLEFSEWANFLQFASSISLASPKATRAAATATVEKGIAKPKMPGAN